MGACDDCDAWIDSELLTRLLFAVLVQPPSSFARSAAERRAADFTCIVFSCADLRKALRNLICAPVLVHFDRYSRVGSVLAPASTGDYFCLDENTGLRKIAPGKELCALAEFMYVEMQAAEACAGTDADGSQVSYAGFQ